MRGGGEVEVEASWLTGIGYPLCDEEKGVVSMASKGVFTGSAGGGGDESGCGSATLLVDRASDDILPSSLLFLAISTAASPS